MPPHPAYRPPGLIVHQACILISLAGQLALAPPLLKPQHAAVRSSAAAHMAANVVVHVIIAALLLKRPLVYWRNRSWLHSIIRIGLYSMPSFRSSSVGVALLLKNPDNRGLHGAVKDWARILLGTRLAGAAVVALALPQQPAITLATQAVLAALICNSPAYCRTQLLASPLTRQRILALATGLEYATLPFMAVAPSGVHWSMGAAQIMEGTVDARPLCRATLYFLNAYIGVVMPTLAACCYRWPPSEPMPTGSQEAPAASWRLRLAWLVRHCSALASTVDRWLVAVAGAHYSGMWRLFVLWHTAVVCWWVSRMAAGIV